MRQPRIAVLLPCYNEETTIGRVVLGFREALPDSDIYVYDNLSKDRTAEEAAKAGAFVRIEQRRGKGNVVRRMFADIDADIYFIADGDDTYDSESALNMVELLIDQNLDMVIGTRMKAGETERGDPYRPGHRFANRLFTYCVSLLFGHKFTDILSGYRVFSHRFVKSFPSMASGFEIETELTIHCLDLKLPSGEILTPYKSRPEGSLSKLVSIRDGLRIFGAIVSLLKDNRPLLFFSILFAALAAISIGLSTPLLFTYLEVGLVLRFPTAILSTGIMLLAFLSLTCGFILDNVTQGRREKKLLGYLALSSVREALES